MNPPIQFGLKTLVFSVCFMAAFFALMRATGLVATGMLLVAVALIAVAVRAGKLYVMARITMALVALPLLWFAGVDWTWTQVHCNSCLLHRDILRYRILGCCVHEEVRDLKSWLGKAADDLGVPCTHPDTWTWYKHRFWGLVICGLPCENGTCCLSDNLDWYDEKTSQVVKSWADTDPTIAEEFVQHGLNERDIDKEFIGNFLRRIRPAIDGRN